MASVCFYFQLHQPLRLRRYSVFDTEANYFDDYRNTELLHKISARCYEPTTGKLLDLVKKLDGRFRFSLCITGLLIDQFREHCPGVLKNLEALAQTGCVEFLNETYYHSLAFLYSRDEFREQVEQHAQMVEELFGQKPRVFRNTELIYNNDLAYYISSLGGFSGILAEGVDFVLHDRSATQLYRPPHTDGIKVALKHYRLSDDIAFRFSNREWPEWPLNSEKFARWVSSLGEGRLCNLFLDMETFGEHQWPETGIFDFLATLPGRILESSTSNRFLTISEALQQFEAADEFDVPHMISWADTERDLSAWLGNAMQSNALHELYKLEALVKRQEDPELLADWRRLTASDHFYYMCTKYYADGAVHKYFNPYESPYDSYINFMNVLDNLRSRAAGR